MTRARTVIAVDRMALFLALCVFVTFSVNFVLFVEDDKDEFFHQWVAKELRMDISGPRMSNPMQTDERPAQATVHGVVASPKRPDGSSSDGSQAARYDTSHHSSSLAGLSCADYGGPPHDAAAEMVYWRDIPSDERFVSPFYDEDGPEKFLLFDMDCAGFNNKRITFENFVLMAHAMGRTLVMPPKGLWKHFAYAVRSTEESLTSCTIGPTQQQNLHLSQTHS